MTYESWGREYYDAALVMKQRYEDAKEELKKCRPEDRLTIARKLQCRYQSYISCLDTARELMRRRGEC